MKIFIGSDHNGFALKQAILSHLESDGYEVVDEGDHVLDPNDDFPQYGARVAAALLASQNAESRGILICGSGQGVCMAANRFKGVRASLVWNHSEARAARNDDDSNILCLPARELQEKDAIALVDTWLTTAFSSAPRFVRRNKQLDELN